MRVMIGSFAAILLLAQPVSKLVMQLDALKKSYLKSPALQVFVLPAEGN